MPRSAVALRRLAHRAAPPGACGRFPRRICGSRAATRARHPFQHVGALRAARAHRLRRRLASLEELPPFKTTVTVDATRKIITRNESPDISFDRSINPYRGCEHGCVYCFARPTHAYLGLSPGLDFETKLFAKPDAPALLERELSATGYEPRTIAIGTNTDPYQPIERQYAIMRGILRGAGARRPSGRHRHQVGAGAARPRHPRADGASATWSRSRCR